MALRVLPGPRYRRWTLDERRRLKMAGSAHAYVRGSTVQFYKWLRDRGDHTATRGEFAKSLNARRSSRLDAPSRLWASVVELGSIHETAYLEHCRLYALA